jgi:hypothetical protein
MDRVAVVFHSAMSDDVSVSSVDPASKQESLIGVVPSRNGTMNVGVLPGTELRVRLLVGTYVERASCANGNHA